MQDDKTGFGLRLSWHGIHCSGTFHGARLENEWVGPSALGSLVDRLPKALPWAGIGRALALDLARGDGIGDLSEGYSPKLWPSILLWTDYPGPCPGLV